MPDEPARVAPREVVSKKFAGLARADTAPEMALRRELHARGRRFRVQMKVEGLPRRSVDVAFTRQRLAVFVDGCFWHGCPEHHIPPARNSDWWAWKVERNQSRDLDTNDRLQALGWQVIRIWEHEPPSQAADRVEEALEESNL